ncbi:MAG: C4-dicarboxylate ABC transporter substrate-binding protein, partial [Clostridia bacterium]|nr:C4-dicarboxylate ABC transporter substrate-binding protein [Clostridia bacterium]
ANSLTAEEKKPFVEATAKVYPMFEKDLGKDLMEIIKKVQK